MNKDDIEAEQTTSLIKSTLLLRSKLLEMENIMKASNQNQYWELRKSYFRL